jgi:hypothetical protein
MTASNNVGPHSQGRPSAVRCATSRNVPVLIASRLSMIVRIDPVSSTSLVSSWLQFDTGQHVADERRSR